MRYLVEQLWSGPMAGGSVRCSLANSAEPGWIAEEAYLLAPSVAKASMLLPTGPQPALQGALLNYRGLRRRKPNLQRAILGAPGRFGVALPFPTLSLQRRRDITEPLLPLAHVASALGSGPLKAAIGIRTGANRKTTLQLVGADGSPQGFAKFAWDPSSRVGVLREGEALANLDQDSVGKMRASAPALLHSGDYFGWPYIVTAPMPLSSRGVRADVPAPTAQELYSLTSLVRRDQVGNTAQFQNLVAEVDRPASNADVSAIRSRAAELLTTLARIPVELPIVHRWHGDLTPWNSARDGDGHLWCWDWESSEPDALAGMDAIHWHTSVTVEAGGRLDGKCLSDALVAARPLLVAARVPRAGEAVIAGVYAATMAERACALAEGAGGWEAGWVLPRDLVDILDTARGFLSSQNPT